MSLNAPAEVAPQPRQSIVGALRSAPTEVKALVASFCLPVLFTLAQSVAAALELPTYREQNSGYFIIQLYAIVGALAAIMLAVAGFLLGRSIARGAHGAWLLALVPYCPIFSFLLYLSSQSETVLLNLTAVITVGILTLLLSPAVRRHCAKK